DDARRLPHEPFDRLAGAASGPVRLLGEEPVHLGEVDPLLVVVQLDPVPEIANHAETVRRRKPPCSSYDDVMTASASRRARFSSGAPTASASGVERRCSIVVRPSAERRRASCACSRQTAPPARAEKPTSSACPHSTQLVRCGRYPATQSSLSWKERTSGSSAGRSVSTGASSSRARKGASA